MLGLPPALRSGLSHGLPGPHPDAGAEGRMPQATTGGRRAKLDLRGQWAVRGAGALPASPARKPVPPQPETPSDRLG